MKKFSLFIIVTFLLMGCSPKTITNMKQEDINEIIFAIDSHEYFIKEDKFEEIYNILQEEFSSKEEIEEIDKRFQLILKSKSKEEVIYVQKDGKIIKQDDNKYVQYTFEKNSIFNLYKKILGNDIFYGEIVLNKSYVKDYEENDVIYSVDPKDVLEITISSYGHSYLLKQDKIEEFIQRLNNTKYYERSDGGVMGLIPIVNIHFKDRQYWFQFIGIEGSAIISFSTKENIAKYEYEEFICLDLKNDDFYHLLQEIMGEYSLQYENRHHNPSYEWVEKIEEGKAIEEVMCERSELDICELE